MSSLMLTPVERNSRARKFGEVFGQLHNLNRLHDGGQIWVNLRPMHNDVTYMQIEADRNGFFWRRRVPQGRYLVDCHGIFGGMVSYTHVGVLPVSPGPHEVDLDLSGAMLYGRVRGVECPYDTTVSLRLSAIGDDASSTAVHTALLSENCRFLFSGVNPGTYRLRGEVPGQGILRRKEISVDEGQEEIDLGALDIEPRPYVRFRLDFGRRRRTPPVDSFSLQTVTEDHGGSFDVPWAKIPSDLGRGHYAMRNRFAGTFSYSLTCRGYRVAEGTLELDRNDIEVVVPLERIARGA